MSSAGPASDDLLADQAAGEKNGAGVAHLTATRVNSIHPPSGLTETKESSTGIPFGRGACESAACAAGSQSRSRPPIAGVWRPSSRIATRRRSMRGARGSSFSPPTGSARTASWPRRASRRPRVWRWQERFAEAGVDGLLADRTRPPGKAPIAGERVARTRAAAPMSRRRTRRRTGRRAPWRRPSGWRGDGAEDLESPRPRAASLARLQAVQGSGLRREAP